MEKEDLYKQHPEKDSIQKTLNNEGNNRPSASFEEDPTYDPLVQKVKEKLKSLDLEYQPLSDGVEEYFLDKKARFIIENNGLMIPRGGKDDRMADNLDNVLAHFDLSGRISLPYADNEKLEKMKIALSRPENKVAGDFLMRTPTEYLKLLIYYAKVGSFDDLRKIFDKFEENKDEISHLANCHQGGPLSVIDQHPVEFISALPGQKLEKLFKRTHLSSVEDYIKLFLDKPYMTNFIGSIPSEVLNYVMDVVKVESVDDLIKLTENEDFRKALTSAESWDKFPDNLVLTMKYFHVEDLDGIYKFTQFQKINEVMAKSSQTNLKILLKVSEVETADDLERLCNNIVISQNIGNTNYSHLENLLADLGVEPENRNKYIYEVITHSFNTRISDQMDNISTLLGTKEKIPENLNDFILDLLRDEDHIEQNLDSVAHLIQSNSINKAANVESLSELKGLMGGFVTPELSKKYLAAPDDKSRTDVLSSYKKMMGQVLGSSKIEIDDSSLAAEIIYLAYRPTGYSIDQIKKLIGDDWNGLEDLTHQLDNIKFNRNGYDMRFNLVERKQSEEYDVASLRKIELFLVNTKLELKLKDLILQSLSEKPEHQYSLPILFGRILEQMSDDRVKAYRENYYSGKGITQEYTEQRLESLSEILRIIPKEEAFYKALLQLLQSDEEIKAVVQSSADRYLWKKNKKHFSKEETACKTRIDEAIKHLSRDPKADISNLLASEEMMILDEDLLNKLKNLDNDNLYKKLLEIRAEKYLSLYGDKEIAGPIVFYDALLRQAKIQGDFVKREMKKVKSLRSDEVAEVKAVISKNVGSYFAKAGAEICTSHCVEMWKEARHAHLNLVYKDQIIGNVMLYFEPKRDYMIARGFNPRKDTMIKFDRYSIAAQIVKVLEDIARANGYREIFVPEQTGWHALSNRDGMVKEIVGISKKNIARVQEQYPDQRTKIDNAEFYVTETGGVSTDKLNLLSLVK